MSVDLEELERLARAASQGSWVAEPDDDDDALHVTTVERLNASKSPMAVVQTGYNDPFEREQQAAAAYIVAIEAWIEAEGAAFMEGDAP